MQRMLKNIPPFIEKCPYFVTFDYKIYLSFMKRYLQNRSLIECVEFMLNLLRDNNFIDSKQN